MPICKETTIDLRRCAQCKSATYCSRRCQCRDWKQHKEHCQPAPQPVSCENTASTSTNSQSANSTQTQSSKSGPLEIIFKPFTRLRSGTYLHDRPKHDVYKLLIDAFRLRENDDYEFEGHKREGSVYNGAEYSLKPFRAFLRLAENRSGLLPAWWNADTRQECEELGMSTEQGNSWSSLKRRVAKRNITRRYEDDKTMPMQLRMIAEVVYGRGVMGQDGSFTLRSMAMSENGQGFECMAMLSMVARDGVMVPNGWLQNY